MEVSIDVTMPSECEIAIQRYFNVPPQQVFEGYTRPDYVERWLLGGEGFAVVTCEIDLRVGGEYRYRWRSEGGEQLGVRGVYREIEEPRLLVFSESFDEPWYPGDGLVSLLFEEQGDGTLLTELHRYGSSEARDAVLASGATREAAAGFDRLEELLEPV